MTKRTQAPPRGARTPACRVTTLRHTFFTRYTLRQLKFAAIPSRDSNGSVPGLPYDDKSCCALAYMSASSRIHPQLSTRSSFGKGRTPFWLAEAADGLRLVFVHVEDRVELGDAQQILNPGSEAKKLEAATFVRSFCQSGDHLSHSRAVDIADVPHIQQNLH